MSSSDERFLELYRANNSPDWHDFYELSMSDLIERMMGELSEVLHLMIPKSPLQLDQIYEILDRVQEIETNSVDIDLDQVKKIAIQRIVPFRISLHCLKAHFVAVVRFQRSIPELILSAKEYDKDSLIKLIKLDLTFLQARFAHRIISEAELMNDTEFLSLQLMLELQLINRPSQMLRCQMRVNHCSLNIAMAH